MVLREIVVCDSEEFTYGWQTLESVPKRFDEFNVRVQAWLNKRNFVLGEGVVRAALKPPYAGEEFSRMEYFMIAPIILGEGPFPFVEHITE